MHLAITIPPSTTPQPTDPIIQKFLALVDLPSITPAQLDLLSQPFTKAEILKTINTLPLHKFPGKDGYTNEFYKQFSDLISPHLTTLYNSASTSGSLPLDMLRSLITATPKPGKGPTSTTNYRTILLLNTDIKIFSKVIATRLMKCLPSLVHPDQGGFIPDRQALDATRRVLNLIHQVVQVQTPSLLLSLDAEKVFNRVHWGFLKAVLAKFGVTGWFQLAMLSLYSNPSARVLSDGTLSKPFVITNGTRQGCPLSPLIFALLMEPLAAKIRADEHISGI